MHTTQRDPCKIRFYSRRLAVCSAVFPSRSYMLITYCAVLLLPLASHCRFRLRQLEGTGLALESRARDFESPQFRAEFASVAMPRSRNIDVATSRSFGPRDPPLSSHVTRETRDAASCELFRSLDLSGARVGLQILAGSPDSGTIPDCAN